MRLYGIPALPVSLFSIRREVRLDCVLALGSRARLVNRIVVGFKSKKYLLFWKMRSLNNELL